jgi:hypothetical protein
MNITSWSAHKAARLKSEQARIADERYVTDLRK